MNTNFKIYENFSAELKEIWQKYYTEKKGPYNGSYDWCYIWFKHFGKDKKLFVITAWDDVNIKLLAPFYKKGNTLYSIGSCPDFYDGLEVLYEDGDYLLEFINFIIEHQWEMDFRFIRSDTDFFRYLLRRIEQERVYKVNIYGYTLKPLIYADKERSNNLRKRCEKREKLARRDFNSELKYDFSPEKNEKHLEEFINFHQSKWKTFESQQTKDFITDLYFNFDHTVLSRLYFEGSNESLAYEFKYKGLNNVLHKSIFSYNDLYSVISPGLCALHYDLSLDIDHIDYGRGSYEYKYFFTNKEDAVLNIRASLSWKRHRWFFYPLRAIKNKLLGGM